MSKEQKEKTLIRQTGPVLHESEAKKQAKLLKNLAKPSFKKHKKEFPSWHSG